MKTCYFLILLNICCWQVTNAQVKRSTFLEIGGRFTNFQDTKFSQVVHAGAGLDFHLGFERDGIRAVWGTGLQVAVTGESASTYENGTTKVIHPRLYFRYLRKINDRLAVGGHLDIFDFYLRSIDGLQNNGNYYITSSDLMGTAQYRLERFTFGLELGFLSFNQEGTGFAFSSPQTILEDGDFDYQNEAVGNPFGFSLFNIRSLDQYFKIRTRINYQLNRRFSAGYTWNLRRFSEVRNFPVTIAAHELALRFNFIQKTKAAPRPID